jgi:isoleucyl-tRNA synthetase
MVDDPKDIDGGVEQAKPPYTAQTPIAEREERILKFWQNERIFEESLTKPAPKGEYVFYDGPPFASGLPHYGHLLQSALKDAIPRYRTMQGYRVRRQWGWDCHGLPVENLVEKELGFKNKRDIEEYGIAKFNNAARVSIMKDVDAWRQIIPRVGRWVDMEHDYKTMDAPYTESVWWAFKKLHGRKLIYEGFKAMHLCPRCGTTLSNNEVALGYQDIKDIAVFVKLPLIDEPGTSLLIWTTTPWTLPGNSAAAVKADATYVKVRVDDGFIVLAKDLAAKVIGTDDLKIYGELSGKDLVGKSYEPPFPYFKDLVHKHKTHAWKVYAAPYVTLEDGTGIVHLAPAYGAEDLELAQKEKIPLIHHVTEDGRFVSSVKDFEHMPVKPKAATWKPTRR